jgi:hypothetical protein
MAFTFALSERRYLKVSRFPASAKKLNYFFLLVSPLSPPPTTLPLGKIGGRGGGKRRGSRFCVFLALILCSFYPSHSSCTLKEEVGKERRREEKRRR